MSPRSLGPLKRIRSSNARIDVSEETYRTEEVNYWQRNSRHNVRFREGRATALETSSLNESDWPKGSTDSRVRRALSILAEIIFKIE